MVNVVVKLESAPSTAPYAASDPIQGNWGADWSWVTTNLFRGTLPSATETVPSLLTRLAEVLPRRISKTYVKQLQARFPQPPATDDPATYEFETHQD